MDGQLVPLDPPKPGSRQAPKTRDEAELEQRITAESFARLLEVLARKNILDSKELIFILMGVDHE
jgi:hypothetical protein